MNETLHISELVRIIKLYGDRSTRKLFHPGSRKSRERDLIAGFGSARVSEAELAKSIFGVGITERDIDYLVLRSQVKKRLLGFMGHLELRDGSPRRRAIYSTTRSLFRARVLLLLGARRTAMQLLPKALKQAREFGLTQRAIECLEALAENASLTGNRAEYRRYDRELYELIELGNAEREANRLSQLSALEFSRRAFGLPGAKGRILEYANRCK